MQALPFRDVKTAVVNASGIAVIRFQPTVGKWTVTSVTCQMSSNLLEPRFKAFVDGVFISGSDSGSMDSDSIFGQEVQAQSTLEGVWTGADVGATATMTITGIKVTP
jgi:hypothetical protein